MNTNFLVAAIALLCCMAQGALRGAFRTVPTRNLLARAALRSSFRTVPDANQHIRFGSSWYRNSIIARKHLDGISLKSGPRAGNSSTAGGNDDELWNRAPDLTSLERNNVKFWTSQGVETLVLVNKNVDDESSDKPVDRQGIRKNPHRRGAPVVRPRERPTGSANESRPVNPRGEN